MIIKLQFSQRSRAVILAVVLSTMIGMMALLDRSSQASYIDDIGNFLRSDRLEAQNALQPDDSRVLNHIKNKLLVPPSTLPYNLYFGVTNNNPSDGQAHVVDYILGEKRNGFYVECGAYTGEVLSNSLFFEMSRGWRGLLIEPDSRNFVKLLSRNRKAYAAHACLADTNVTKSATFLNNWQPFSSRIFQPKNLESHILTNNKNSLQSFDCFPLYSLLLALSETEVDYFSLDVEGTEYKILSALPWQKLSIKTWSVEYNLLPEGKEALILLMESNEYVLFMEFNTVVTHDLIFIRNDVLKDYKERQDKYQQQQHQSQHKDQNQHLSMSTEKLETPSQKRKLMLQKLMWEHHIEDKQYPILINNTSTVYLSQTQYSMLFV